MDFVEIRRRAKERADARGAGAPAAGAAPEGPSGEEGHLDDLFVELPPEPERSTAEERPRGEEAPPAEEGAFEPAPRWPGLDGGDGLVAALREELVDGAPVPAPPSPRVEPASADPTAAWTVPGWTAPAAPPPPAWEPEPAPAPQQWTLAAHAPAEPPPGADPDPLADFFFDPAEAAPALETFGAPAATAPPRAEGSDARRELLGFYLGEEEYAVDIERVREVLKAPAITEVPRAPAHVLGVIMVRGEVIAVFDPRRRLALPPAPPSRTSRVLVCDGGDGPIGLLVDAVSQVVRLRRSEVEARPQGIGGVAAEYIAGIGRDRDRMFILLDLRAILRGAPLKEARA